MGLKAVEINILIDEALETDLEPAWLEAVAGEVLAAENVGADTEVELLISTQERIQELNRDYRGKDEPTDVLAFSAREQAADSPPFIPPPDGVLHLGEVIISYPQALKQAEERGHPLKKELAILLIHGLLHLLGYDHEEEAQEHKMQAREKELLSLIEGGTK